MSGEIPRFREGSVLKHAWLLVATTCLAAGTLWAQESSFVGEWKMNAKKSKLTDEMKVTGLGGNKYTFDFGGGDPETIVVDGTDQPGNFGTTMSTTVVSKDEWIGVRKKNGKTQIKGIWTLSKDGNKLHDDFTYFPENGKTVHLIYVYERRGPGSGFAGDWVSTSEQVDSVVIWKVRAWESDGLEIVMSGGAGTKRLKFDGTDQANVGAVVEGQASSGKRVSERSIEVTDKFEGKVRATEDMEVSADGKTLTVTLHIPGRDEPDVQVFEKE